jgi:hypothetical protein
VAAHAVAETLPWLWLGLLVVVVLVATRTVGHSRSGPPQDH